MNPRQIFTAFSLLVFLLFSTNCFSQTEDKSKIKKNKNGKGFHAGFYLGSYFAHKYTAKFYDGYGYDADGKKNDFLNSFMNKRINIDYGGGYGQPDRVALALGVNPGEWIFDQTDMPANMKYNPAFLIGLQMNFGITKKDQLLLNVNASKLMLSGNFTIVVINPLIGPQQPGYQNIKTFSITGGEQRLMFQLGYRRILGDTKESVLNFFIEGGATGNMTKFLRNQVTINNLQIDLSYYYTQSYFPTYRAKYLHGVGIGAFAGFGCNITANPKWNLQLLYSSSFEKINIGEDPRHTLQNAIGVRAFYNL
ncbi:MAG: hypothetical protein AABZ32_11425 [Bacteroidota bacterium]